MEDRYHQICEQLMDRLAPGFGGRSRPDLVAEVARMTREIESLGNDGYIREKAASVREWVGIACSVRRHAPWGLNRVEQFAYDDAFRLLGARTSS